MTARTTVTQRFANPTSEWQGRRLRVSAAGEGRRRSPRDEDRRSGGSRGRSASAARRAPRTSRRRPRAARPRSSSRSGPNVFTTSVAHIGPGEEVTVTIEYQETLRYDTGAFRLRFPMVVAPRYVPGHDRRRRRVRHRLGREHGPGARRGAHHATGRASGRGIHQSGDDQRRAQSRIRAVEDRQSLPPDRRQRIRGPSVRGHARQRPGPGEPRLRARLDARRRRRARRRRSSPSTRTARRTRSR